MATIPPIVRHMVVCDGVARGEAAPPKLNVLGVIHTVRAKAGQVFPLRHPSLCVYLMLTGGVGTANVQIRVVEADTGTDLFGSPVHEITHPLTRHEIANIVFRLEECSFPRPGLYWVEFHHDGIAIAQESVIVRVA